MLLTVKVLLIALLVSGIFSGCIEGPMGPDGVPGEKGEQGDPGEPGDGIVESKTFIVTSQGFQVTYYASLGYSYIVTLEDDWFESDCGYIIEQTGTAAWPPYNEISGDVSTWFVTGGVLNQFAVRDGICVYGFVYALNNFAPGCLLTFYKIKPSVT